MDAYCFVIQPFDGGKFDRRYHEVFRPALEACGVAAYRVDTDPHTEIIIDAIEEKIRGSRLCLADITTDNPNVWYELGYAVAAGKPVILVCSEERTTGFPFDIRHRAIVRYGTGSPSDFEKLREAIEERARAVLEKPETENISVTPSIYAEDLEVDSDERAFIRTILFNQGTPSGCVTAQLVKAELKDYGMNEIEINITFRKLAAKQLVFETTVPNITGDGIESAFVLSEKGDAWVLEHANLFAPPI